MRLTNTKNYQVLIKYLVFFIFLFCFIKGITQSLHPEINFRPSLRNNKSLKFVQEEPVLSEDSIHRLVRGNRSVGYAVWKPLDSEFISHLIGQIEEQEIISDVLLEELIGKFTMLGNPVINKSTLKVGLVLETMRLMMEETGLDKLDLADWFKNYRELLLSLYSDITTELALLHLAVIEKATGELRETYLDTYRAIENFVRRLYVIDIFQRTGLLETEGKNLTTLEDEVLNDILDVLTFKPIRQEVIDAGIIPGAPGLYTMGETTPEIYEDFKNRWLLHELIEFELEAFTRRYVREHESVSEITQIEIEVYEMSIREIDDKLKTYGYEEFLEFMTESQKRTALIEKRITYFLNSSEYVANFIKDNLGNIQRYARFVFDWQPTGFDTSLLDYLTVSEAEDVVRSVIKTYLLNKIKLVAPSGEIDLQAKSVREMVKYNFHYYINKNNNRIAALDLTQTFKEFEQLDETMRIPGPLPAQTEEKWKQYRLQHLFKKVITSGVFDLSLKALQEEFRSSITFGLEEISRAGQLPIIINSFYKFYKENISGNPAVRFIFQCDNHAQILYVLGVAELILRFNPNAQVVIIPKAIPVGDDVAYQDLIDILETDKVSVYPLFQELRHNWGERFITIKSGSQIQGEDFRQMSDESLKFFTNLEYKGRKFDRIVVVNVGNAHLFTQLSTKLTPPLSEKIDFYFIYRVKNPSSEAVTGISMKDRPLIFAYVKLGSRDEKGNILGLGSPVVMVTDPRTDELINVVAYTILEHAKKNREQPYDYIILEPYE